MREIERRVVAPEILDDLPEDDPRAVASRRDLVRVNALMFQIGIMADLLRTHVPRPPRRIVEIGSGDGRFMERVARRLAPHWPGVEVVLLDRQDHASDERRRAFADLGWRASFVRADVFDWMEGEADGRFDAVAANLFLHHFDDAALARLLRGAARLAPVLVATEPFRAAFPLLASNCLRVIGANDVTRHDAAASVRAGFRGREIGALWPHDQPARSREGRRGLFTHAFAAVAEPERGLS